IEQHLLKLLGARKVDAIAANGGVRRLRGLLRPSDGLAMELGQLLGIDGHSCRLHMRERHNERQLKVAVQLTHVSLFDELLKLGREQEHRGRAASGTRGLRPVEAKVELALVRRGIERDAYVP